MQRLIVPLSLLSLVLLWQGLAVWLASPLLPSPWQVFQRLGSEAAGGELLHHLGVTLGRLGISFVAAMLLGCTLGILMGRHPLLDRWLDPWLTVFLNIPALVTIILCYVWFGLTEAAAILAVVVNKLPNVAVTLREGSRHLDTGLLEMAQVYRFGRWKTLRHVIWPQLYPFVVTAARTGLALIWKIILVVELLGRSDGMGYQLHLFFQLFDVTGILAYTVAFVIVIQLLEWTVLQPLDRFANRWRR
ncbi:NitT/TauT family transport system permease protein [Methylomarinovum caldicuralii]|uniref:NitT/TauT family transport system permease protein n=1 Tax=Methylomarinovum caldicuralii TaxID=438856 RepID=A0AAU9C1H1_9GAMM|nr:ABC transporter permease [Methylomarinovum caldicuralii]BCX81433.1 NitT/TauT family transport system permease protein [Methylomarinovum caldicuralii]